MTLTRQDFLIYAASARKCAREYLKLAKQFPKDAAHFRSEARRRLETARWYEAHGKIFRDAEDANEFQEAAE